VNWELGELDVAGDHLRLAADSLRSLVADRRGEPEPALLLARALEGTALVARQRGEIAEAEAALREGQQVLHAAIGADPKDEAAAQHLLSAATLLADVLARSRRMVEGAALLQATLARVDASLDGAGVSLASRRTLRNGHYWLAWIVEQTGDVAAAVASLERALVISHDLALLPDPDVNDLELDASYRAQLAKALHRLRRDDAARPLANAARADLEAIVQQWPMSSGFRLDLASSLTESADLERAGDAAADVTPMLRRAVALAQASVAEAPEDLDALDKLLSAQIALAIARDDVGDVSGASELLKQATELAQARLARTKAWSVPLVGAAALAHFDRAIVAVKQKDGATARAAFTRARELADWLCAGDGSNRAARTLRLQIVTECGALENGDGRFDEALADWSEAESGARQVVGGDLAVVSGRPLGAAPLAVPA
jgi:tetratricopeptide (TPR) repeat protein